MHDNHQSQGDQSNGDDQLQAVNHEHKRTGRDRAENTPDRHTQSGHRHAEHDRHRNIKHPTLAARGLQEDGQACEHQSRKQLVGRTKERPNAHVTGQAQEVAQHEREDRGKNRVREKLLNAILFNAFRRREEFLQAHAADTSHGVHTRQGQSGHTHRHDASAHISGQTENFRQERGDGIREQLEGGAGGQHAVSGGSTHNDQGHHAQNRFHAHGAVTNETHVFFIGNHLGRRAGRHKAVETGNSAAGNRHKEHREEIQPLDFKADKSGHVDFGVFDKHADHATQNHADQKEHTQVVARLLQKPHRHHGCAEEVGKNHIAPGDRISVNRVGNTDPEHQNHQNDADNQLFGAGGLSVLEVQTESDSHEHVEDGNRSGCSVRHDFRALGGKAVKGIGHDVAEGGDHQQGKEPAEKQEQLTTGAADVLFNHHAHGLAAVFDGSVKGGEVLNRTEEDAAEDHPKGGGEPTKHGRDNRAGDGACARDGGKLVRENGPLARGHVIVAVIFQLCRRLSVGVNAPGVFEPPCIEAVTDKQRHDCTSH